MLKQLLPAMLLAALAVLAPPVGAADLNYNEYRGNVVGMRSVTEYNTLTGVSTLKEVGLTLLTVDRGVEWISITCPTDGSSLYYLCRNRVHWFDGACPTAVATPTCYPGPSGICVLEQTEVCTSGVGRCAWGWGYLRTSGGQTRPHLDMLYTQNSSSCTAK